MFAELTKILTLMHYVSVNVAVSSLVGYFWEGLNPAATGLLRQKSDMPFPGRSSKISKGSISNVHATYSKTQLIQK